jgi:hypothetical protein
MSTQPMTDRGLAETSGTQRSTGSRLLLLGGVLFAVGLVLMLATDGAGDFVGVVFAALSTPPTLAGIAMLLSGLVGGRAAQHKDFA